MKPLTQQERDDVEELPGRQPGCPDKTCGVCKGNARRGAALERLLALYDVQRELLISASAFMGLDSDAGERVDAFLRGDE